MFGEFEQTFDWVMLRSKWIQKIYVEVANVDRERTTRPEITVLNLDDDDDGNKSKEIDIMYVRLG